MAFLLPPLIAGTFLPDRSEGFRERYGYGEKAALSFFFLLCCLVLTTEAFILAYPGRTDKNGFTHASLAMARERFPNEVALQDIRCKELLWEGDEAGFHKCLGARARISGNKLTAYFFSVISSHSSADLALPPGNNYQRVMFYHIARMLREFELGERNAAMVSFKNAYSSYESKYNCLTQTPYQRDKEIDSIIKQDSDRFWNVWVFRILLIWPPERMEKILSELQKSITVSNGLSEFAMYLKDLLEGDNEYARCELRKIRVIQMWTPDQGRSLFLKRLPCPCGRFLQK
jgi:hypothetical protein